MRLPGLKLDNPQVSISDDHRVTLIWMQICKPKPAKAAAEIGHPFPGVGFEFNHEPFLASAPPFFRNRDRKGSIRRQARENANKWSHL